MSTNDDADGRDDAVLASLQRIIAQIDPVPPAVVAAARDSLDWLDLDAELARLTADSLQATAQVRGTAARLLTYQVGDLTIEIEASDTGGRLRILGQMVPPQRARVQADQPTGDVEVLADSLGRFSIGELPPGPTRFRCTLLGSDGEPSGPPVCTEWTVL